MYLHFQDWSHPVFLEQLDQNQLPHEGRIFKVYTTEEDPRLVLGRSALTVVETESHPFTTDEVFIYPDRETYAGDQLEEELQALGLQDPGQCSVRATLRFSNQVGFCQGAMAARKGDDWLIGHPFEEIDGLKKAVANQARERLMHLDIFFPSSLPLLKGIVDYDDPTKLLDPREGVRFLKPAQKEVEVKL